MGCAYRCEGQRQPWKADGSAGEDREASAQSLLNLRGRIMYYRQQVQIVCAECGTEATTWQTLDGGPQGKAFAPETPAGWAQAGPGAVCAECAVVDATEVDPDVTMAGVG